MTSSHTFGKIQLALVSGLFVLLAHSVQAQEAKNPLSEREKVIHLLSRLSYAPTESMVAYVQSIGRQAWLKDQLQAAAPRRVTLQQKMQKLPSVEFSIPQSLAFIRSGEEMESGKLTDQEKRKEVRQRAFRLRGELMASILLRGYASDRQAEEVMADFWRNHFNVTFRKGQQAALMITDWDREVIRGQMWGDFPSMLEATAKHPAMLHYLDQHLSRRKLSEKDLQRIRRQTLRRSGSEVRAQEAVAKAAKGGPNENYARELMELHTLGVDQVYRQRDVVVVAEALTGWTLNRGSRKEPGDFDFRFEPRWHEAGGKTLFNEALPEADPQTPAQGEFILDLLADHPATGEFLARKLVRYLVADEAPEQIVQHVAAVFEQSNGDLTQLVFAVVEHPDFYAAEHFRAKVKTPWEFILSALRVTGAQVNDPRQLFRVLSEMGQPLYGCDVPTGWSDTAEAWLDPGAMAYRWDFASRLAAGQLRGAKIPQLFYAQALAGAKPSEWAERLALHMIPAGLQASTSAALDQVLQSYLARAKVKNNGPKASEVVPELVALILGSPDFQRQ